jgi:hypothetical protein
VESVEGREVMATDLRWEHDPLSRKTHLQLAFESHTFAMNVMERVVAEIAQQAATKFIEEHYPEIASKIDPQAIANLAIAAAGAKINETLHKKMPDVIREVVRKETVVYERGIFGGIRRIT